jgi:hypothetical protein
VALRPLPRAASDADTRPAGASGPPTSSISRDKTRNQGLELRNSSQRVIKAPRKRGAPWHQAASADARPRRAPYPRSVIAPPVGSGGAIMTRGQARAARPAPAPEPTAQLGLFLPTTAAVDKCSSSAGRPIILSFPRWRSWTTSLSGACSRSGWYSCLS